VPVGVTNSPSLSKRFAAVAASSGFKTVADEWLLKLEEKGRSAVTMCEASLPSNTGGERQPPPLSMPYRLWLLHMRGSGTANSTTISLHCHHYPRLHEQGSRVDGLRNRTLASVGRLHRPGLANQGGSRMSRQSLMAGAAMLCCAFGASPALAQDMAQEGGVAQAGDDAAASEDGLREIVVTAQRRAENLQDVSIAATALAGGELAAKAIQRFEDLENASPALSITDQGLTQSVNIRGIGIASGSPQVTNGVATYIDGIIQPQIVGTSTFYDIMSIEVLRGPQGTLVGSNSTGGAMFINSQVPELGRLGGYAQAGYGSYDHFEAQGALNLPLGDTLAIRAAGLYATRDSYYRDAGPLRNQPDSLSEKNARLIVRWEPGAFRATGKIEFIDKQSGGYAYRPIPTPFAAGRSADLRTVTYDSPTLNDERGTLASLELRYEFSGGIVLRSVSGYTNKRIDNLYDTDATVLATQTQDQYVREREWTQEINLISPTDGAFNWILGGYYQRNKIDVDLDIRAGAPTDPTDVLIATDKTTTGIFAQGGYKPSSRIELQLGLRYSHFKSEGTGSVTIGNGSPFFPPGGLRVADPGGLHRDSRLTGKAAINWTPDDDNLLYAFAARGYKAGGFNSPTSEFGPETVWDYEIGWKSSFLDNHLRTQAGAFYMTYQGFQFDAVDTSTGLSGTTNIADASLKGVEFQAQARFGGLGLDGGISYVDSSLDGVNIVNSRLLPPGGTLGPQCPAGIPPMPPVCFNYAPFFGAAGGGKNLFSPDWTYNFSAHYEVPLGGDATLTPRLNYAYLGPRYTNLFYSPATDYLAGRGLLSALLTLDIDAWRIEGWATNLLNKKYITGQSGNNEFYGAPREYGVRASIRF
jgi:iron complex outermembrane receptor protein